MRIKIIYSLMLTVISSFVFAQEGRIEINQATSITRLVDKHTRINDSLGTMAGYRIQLIFTSGVNGKKLAQEVEADFIKKYPDAKAYLLWDSPNYKVRVGDFRTRLDALKFQDAIKNDFPSGYIVQDNISLSSSR